MFTAPKYKGTPEEVIKKAVEEDNGEEIWALLALDRNLSFERCLEIVEEQENIREKVQKVVDEILQLIDDYNEK
jgi:t-SNARE complex subunit (syntaxin)